MLRYIALVGMLAGVLSLGSLGAQQAGKATPPRHYEATARQIIAARHQIPLSQLANGRSSAVDYPLTKRQAFIYTVSEWSEVGGIALNHVTGFERDGGVASPPDPQLLAPALRLLVPIPQTVAEVAAKVILGQAPSPRNPISRVQGAAR